MKSYELCVTTVLDCTCLYQRYRFQFPTKYGKRMQKQDVATRLQTFFPQRNIKTGIQFAMQMNLNLLQP
jgi:hypothetical protein